MKVLVTGSQGQLGRDVVDGLSPHTVVYGFGRRELDITDMQQVKQLMQAVHPDVVVHCAAYTAVDKAEEEREEAFRVNAAGTRNVAVCTESVQGKFCYISTDYVFDGRSPEPYTEYDTPNPLSVYGKSKYAGEELVRMLCTKPFIVRTAWVYGGQGNSQNFVRTILEKAREGRELKVVNDQTGSPTYTRDLAEFLLELIRTERYGIYHATNRGHCTWYEFAEEILKAAGLQARLSPCATSDLQRQARRPSYSVLEHLAIRSSGMRDLRPWQEAVREYVKQLC